MNDKEIIEKLNGKTLKEAIYVLERYIILKKCNNGYKNVLSLK